MKDIVTYINEVSKGLVRRAYNKASGAQKNRLKKLYKDVYGDDLTKNNISHIKINSRGEYENYEWDIKDVLTKTSADISKIQSVTLKDYESGRNRMSAECTIELSSGDEIEEWAEWKAVVNYPEDPSDYEFSNGTSEYDDYYSAIDLLYKALEKLPKQY